MTSQKWVVRPGNQPTDVPDPTNTHADDTADVRPNFPTATLRSVQSQDV